MVSLSLPPTLYAQNWHYGPPHRYLINLTVCGIASKKSSAEIIKKNCFQLRNCYNISSENLIKITARNEYWYGRLDIAPTSCCCWCSKSPHLSPASAASIRSTLWYRSEWNIRKMKRLKDCCANEVALSGYKFHTIFFTEHFKSFSKFFQHPNPLLKKFSSKFLCRQLSLTLALLNLLHYKKNPIIYNRLTNRTRNAVCAMCADEEENWNEIFLSFPIFLVQANSTWMRL